MRFTKNSILLIFFFSQICLSQTQNTTYKQSDQKTIDPGDQYWDEQFNSNTGLNEYVGTICSNGEDIYMGGYFTKAGGLTVNYIAKFNEKTGWSSIGSGLSYLVGTIVVVENTIWAGGHFGPHYGKAGNYIAYWNGNTWVTPNGGADNNVGSMIFDNNQLYVVGCFLKMAGINSSLFARLDIKTNLWYGVSVVFDKPCIDCLVKIQDDIFLGGNITSVDGITINNITKYSTITNLCSPLGNGVSGTSNPNVQTIVADGDDLYVGGNFTAAGGIQTNYIAKWNRKTNTWSSLGKGLNNSVYSIAVVGDEIVVGGEFTKAGDLNVNKVARWNKTSNSWSSIGSGFDKAVYVIRLIGNYIYFGGGFNSAGGKPANYLARYNASYLINTPGIPTLVSPANGSNGVSVNTYLLWNSVSGATSYNIQLSTDPSFSSVLLNLANVNQNTYPLSGLALGTKYYWRVNANNTDGTSGWSDTWSFKVISITSAPALGLPVDGAVRVSKSPTLSWNASTDATYYDIQVATTSTFVFGTIVLDQTNLTSTFQIVNGLKGDAGYHWHVRAKNSISTSEWSTTFYFKTQNTPPGSFSILSPANNSIVSLANPNNLVNFSWNKSIDDDGNTVTYTLNVAGNSVNRRMTGIQDTATSMDIISELKPSMSYQWYVEATDGLDETKSSIFIFSTSNRITGVNNQDGILTYSLTQNYPNPFNPETKFEYYLPGNAYVLIKIYNTYGKEIENLVERYQSKGIHSVSWHPANLPSGIYYYRIQAGRYSEIRKMVYLR